MKNLSGAHVLVVDDEPVLNLTFALVLRREGAEVMQAANGAEALAIVRKQRVDVILCDKQMPVMDGLTFLRAMHAEHCSRPTLLFVNGVDHEDMVELAAMHVERLLTKPVQPAALLTAVDEVLQQPSAKLAA